MGSGCVDRRSTAGNIETRCLSVEGIADGLAAPPAPADLRTSNVPHSVVDFGRKTLAQPKGKYLSAVAMQREANPAWSTATTLATGVASRAVTGLTGGMACGLGFRLATSGGNADLQEPRMRRARSPAAADPDATRADDVALCCDKRIIGRAMRWRSPVAGHGLSQRTSGPAWLPRASNQALA